MDENEVIAWKRLSDEAARGMELLELVEHPDPKYCRKYLRLKGVRKSMIIDNGVPHKDEPKVISPECVDAWGAITGGSHA